jgi:hypothetical protein
VIVRLLLVCLVVLGTSGFTLAPILCSQGLCPQECDVHTTTAQGPKSAGCCEEQPQTSKEKSCKCEFKAAPEAPQSVPTVNLSVETVSIDLPAREFLPEVHSTDAVYSAILFHSDTSPPDHIRHPNAGRAPPVS